ncbi:MAG: hypothetical protein EBX41_06585 [Chitinophagia bacterium]|nr:hypothetical protein [Chitinophagia bacterium]
MAKIVQFFHPQSEAAPYQGKEIIEWNNSRRHKRKFIKNQVKYVNEDNTEQSDTLTFLGEWEPQSRVEKLI